MSTSESGLPMEAGAGGTRLPSWMQKDTTVPAVAAREGSRRDAKRPVSDERDTKPKSLLRQHHIRVPLVIDALYSLSAL